MESQPLKLREGPIVRESLASKLKTARALTGMATRTVADRLQKAFSVSHATIANYETGRTVPPIDVLAALAEVYERPLNWFLERGRSLAGVQYRNLKSRVKANDLHRFEGDAQRWLDAYIAIEARINRPLIRTVPEIELKSRVDTGELSRKVREAIGLGDVDPVPSVTDTLERFGIRVLEIATDLRIDGFAARYEDEHVVVLNRTVSNDRSRLNAAHELAHVLLGDCDGELTPEKEQRAFDFGSQFLLPNRILKEAFDGQSMVRLVQFKERYGISLAAMVYRAERLKFITKPTAKMLWIEFARRGWKTKEPGAVRPDRATRFEQLIEVALSSKQMSLKEVADLCGVRPEAIRDRLNLAIGIEETLSPEDEGAGIFKFPQT